MVSRSRCLPVLLSGNSRVTRDDYLPIGPNGHIYLGSGSGSLYATLMVPSNGRLRRMAQSLLRRLPTVRFMWRPARPSSIHWMRLVTKLDHQFGRRRAGVILGHRC